MVIVGDHLEDLGFDFGTTLMCFDYRDNIGTALGQILDHFGTTLSQLWDILRQLSFEL